MIHVGYILMEKKFSDIWTPKYNPNAFYSLSFGTTLDLALTTIQTSPFLVEPCLDLALPNFGLARVCLQTKLAHSAKIQTKHEERVSEKQFTPDLKRTEDGHRRPNNCCAAS